MNIVNFIGNTPLLEAERGLFLKLEYLNPSGSVKDRAAKYILSAAALSRGDALVEATSGNFGISLAMLSAAFGYKFTAVMPRSVSSERERIIRAYGAEVIFASNMAEAVAVSRDVNGFKPRQFENPLNPLAHYETTGPEIWRDTKGNVDILLAGVGSGGTIMGVGRYLKEQNPAIRIISLLPRERKHKIEGIGPGFASPLYDETLVNETVFVTDAEAALGSRQLIRMGIFAGVSSGAAYFAAKELIGREENMGKSIALILPDSADRYFSCGLL